MISPEKATMFRNRLTKVFRHVSKSPEDRKSAVTGSMTMTCLNFHSVLKYMKTGSMWQNIAVIIIWRKKNTISGLKIVKSIIEEITGRSCFPDRI